MTNKKKMRKFLYRGKRIDNNEWVFGIFIPDALETVKEKRCLKGYIRNYDEDGDVIMYTVDRKSVGEYTGLNDRNDNKIFEGDIVKWCNGIYVAIEYIQEYARFAGVNGNSIFGLEDTVREKRIEIVGNIYDNPELLKDDELI